MDKFDYLKKKVETYAYVALYTVSAIGIFAVIVGSLFKYLTKM